MYYHLLDGDWASNTCSWQWVAGANSSKKYYANQENINKYMRTNQRRTVLDVTYEELSSMDVPQGFSTTELVRMECTLPETNPLQVDPQQPTFVYNYYNLDPDWHRDQPGNRVLLLEPNHFDEYPISRKCLDFVLELSRNIPGIQVHVGSFQSVSDLCNLAPVIYKEHPLNQGYMGIEEPRDWIAPDVTGYYPSFFGYWKQVEKSLRKNRTSYLNG
jgi:deoxyribodipyrimidine photo-lyase